MTGKDGLVQVAKIKTAQGRTNCPIVKLIPLEVSTSTISITGRPSSTVQQDTIAGDMVERPQREAGRERVKDWVQQLGRPPEDFMD